MRFLNWIALLAVVLLSGCGGGSESAGRAFLAGTWVVVGASAPFAASISCPGALRQNGFEIFSCNRQDNLQIAADGTFTFYQTASGTAIPNTLYTSGKFTVSGNHLITQGTVTASATVDGTYRPISVKRADVTYIYVLDGDTLLLTTLQRYTLRLTRAIGPSLPAPNP